MNKYQLNQYKSEIGTVYWKMFQGTRHPAYLTKQERKSGKKEKIDLGMAFRTKDNLLGFLPFYDKADNNLNGEVSIGELLSSNFNPFSKVASPHIMLIQAVRDDPNFCYGPGNNLRSVYEQVEAKALRQALAIGKEVFLEATVTLLAGPAVSSIVKQFTKSAAAEFLISSAVEGRIIEKLKNGSSIEVKPYSAP